MKILVVEDKYFETATNALGNNGNQIILAKDLQSALPKINDCDVVVTDIMIPEIFEKKRGKVSKALQVIADVLPGAQIKGLKELVKGVDEYTPLDKKDIQSFLSKMTNFLPNFSLRKKVQTGAMDIINKNIQENSGEDLQFNRGDIFSYFIASYCKVTLSGDKLERCLDGIIDNWGFLSINPFLELEEGLKKNPQKLAPLGLLVAKKAEELGKPFVVISALDGGHSADNRIMRLFKKFTSWNLHLVRNKKDPGVWKTAFKSIKF